MKNKILIATLIIICSLHSFASTIIPGGNVYGYWSISGSPYLIQGHIIIPSDSTLTIAPGVIVQFQGHYKLFCNGRILAIGTVTDSINFNVRSDSLISGWWGLRFDNTPSTNDSSLLVFCKIQYGNANGTGNDSKGGAICLNNFSKLRISNSRIINNKASSEGGGVYCGNNSSPIIADNIINNNNAIGNSGGGISIYNNSSPIISGNTISNNNGLAVGGGISIYYPCSPIISNNTISNNTATGYYSEGGGIYCGSGSSSAISTIIGNIIRNNSASASGGGIYCYEIGTTLISGNTINGNIALGSSSYQGGGGIYCNGGSHTIINNIICNNSASLGGGIKTHTNSPITNNVIINNTANSGGGIYTGNSPNIYNCTIANNLASNVSGGGGALFCGGGYNPVLKNVILFGNAANSGNGNSVYLDNVSNPSFSYCNVEGGSASFYTNGNPYTGNYSNNINTNPLFVSPSGGSGTGYNGASANWTLQNGSPCTNSGDPNKTYTATDLAGNPRVVCIIDMGAYENQNSLKPIVGFTINNTTQCLNGNNFLFNDTSNISSGTLTRRWNFGTGNFDTSSSLNPVKSYSGANSYQIKLVSISNNNCKDSLIKTVTVYAQPKVGFTVNNLSQCLTGNRFSFDDTTSGTATRLWNLNYSTTSTNDTPSITYTSTGQFNVKLKVTDSHNCTDSATKLIIVKPNPVQPAITALTKSLLQSSAGNSYQWYLNNYVIPGATSQTLTLSTNGAYKVRIDSSNGCSNFSTPFTALAVGVNERSNAGEIKIYPNPNTGKFTINFNSLQGEKQITIFDIHGKLISHFSISKNEIEIQPENILAKGIYILKIQTETGMMNAKFVVE